MLGSGRRRRAPERASVVLGRGPGDELSLLLGRGLALEARLPLLVRHPVDDLARVGVRQRLAVLLETP